MANIKSSKKAIKQIAKTTQNNHELKARVKNSIRNAKKIKGAKETIKLIKNNVKISSICNDIVGDICGIVSGGLGAVLAISIANITKVNISLISVITAALISSLTIGGKAIFKTVAIKNSDKIIFSVGKLLSFFKK